jgi:hypothetical protein
MRYSRELIEFKTRILRLSLIYEEKQMYKPQMLEKKPENHEDEVHEIGWFSH